MQASLQLGPGLAVDFVVEGARDHLTPLARV